jgi:flagellar M-ring protein FliF
MASALDSVLTPLAGFWRALSAAQRVALASIVLVTLGAVALVTSFARQSEYATLYSGLAPADAAAIVDELSSMQVPFELAHAGTAVQVPVERVYDARLELAQKGLPASGPVGLEAFDDAPIGMTPFQQRVRFRRAIEGELSRTISRLGPVSWARVHINLPDKQLFRRDAPQTSASVVLSLLPGQSLSAPEARGIAQLIAGAVEGLDVDRVSILDASGRMLVRPRANEEEALAADALDVQRSIERELAARAQGLLDAALGAGKSVVSVSARVDTRRVEEKQDKVNPEEAAIVSEQRTEENRSETAPIPSGVPGVAANVPGGTGAAVAAQPSTESITRETTNFEFTRSTSRTVAPMGAVQRLSVAVMVDGTYQSAPPAEEGQEPPAPVYQPRGAEELQQLGEIVKRAVGFDAERGDVIEVQNLPFHSPLDDLVVGAPSFWERPEFMMLVSPIARGIAVLGAIALLALLVIRPALRQLSTGAGAAGTGAVGPAGAAALPAAGQAGAALDQGEIAIPVSRQDAKQVAEAIRQWLRE